MHHTHFVLPPQLVFDTQNKNQVINQTGGTTIQGFVKHREGIGRIDMRGSQQEEQQQQQQQQQQHQQQDRRVRSLQPDDQQQLPPQQPQKCPRCESLNTKFCYYNNYSLSQPRYFCKTCRRYWTQGGTLRNVPVGGGCRKGKRPKRSSSVDQQQNQPPPNSAATTTASTITSNPSLRNQDTANMASPAIPLVPVGSSSYFPGGGFFSPLPGIQSFNQPINFAGDLGGSNLALLQGFNLPSFNPSQQQQQVFQVGTRDKIMHHLLPSMDNVIQPDSRPSTSTSHHQGWHQSLINSSTNSIATDPVYWSSGSNSNANHPTSTTVPSLNTSQWPDLSGYGPPPSSSSPSFP